MKERWVDKLLNKYFIYLTGIYTEDSQLYRIINNYTKYLQMYKS